MGHVTSLTPDRRERVARSLADRVIREAHLYGRPVPELTHGQAIILEAVLRGPHCDEVLDALGYLDEE